LPPEQTCTVTVDGTALAARPGQTIAAILMAAGVHSFRTTRRGQRPRGLFCGIGVCFDCLVILNGTPNVRACVTLVAEGDVIETQEGTGHGHLAG
jgi:predicted molibdopterin-dependent oxidoreductase YjgC